MNFKTEHVTMGSGDKLIVTIVAYSLADTIYEAQTQGGFFINLDTPGARARIQSALVGRGYIFEE